MADGQVLTGIIVAERAGRLAVAVCASLLAELGAPGAMIRVYLKQRSGDE
ncbi:MAG: hypothetical protein HY848_18400 [Betaproteobacteria bacterium]|nr:hypothetical protein [Betaproteobacteria bacterium]